MKRFWFELDWFSDSVLERRRPENSLHRIVREAKDQEESQIETWLDLAKRFFDKDDDPDPQAA